MDAKISTDTWGDLRTLTLASPAISVTVAPDLGGRIISLADRRSGREWLTTGPPPTAAELEAWAGEDAVFDGRVSFGWDECLPTVAPCADPLDGSAAPLRDHGDQWGRPAPTDGDALGGLTTTWPRPRWGYAFTRRLSIPDDATLRIDYAVRAPDDRGIPVLWSMHPCLRLEPGARLEVDDAPTVRLTYAGGIDLQPGQVAWPLAELAGSTDDAPRLVDLARVTTDEGWAAKLYAGEAGTVRALTPDGSSLTFERDPDVAAALGVWLDYGGWPPEGPPVEQVALEPTTSGHDDLAGAMADGEQRTVGAGTTLRWSVSLVLGAPSGP